MRPSAQEALTGIALLMLGAVLFLMVFFPIPSANHDFVVFILGALSGACVFGGGQKSAGAAMKGAEPEMSGGEGG